MSANDAEQPKAKTFETIPRPRRIPVHNEGLLFLKYFSVIALFLFSFSIQLDVSAYIEIQKTSLRKYVSQFTDDKMALMSSDYENTQSPDGTACEQFVLARVKNDIGNTTSYLLKLINFTQVNQP